MLQWNIYIPQLLGDHASQTPCFRDPLPNQLFSLCAPFSKIWICPWVITTLLRLTNTCIVANTRVVNYLALKEWINVIPYNGKFLKGFIFKNFQNGQAFLKVSFQNFYSQLAIHSAQLHEWKMLFHANILTSCNIAQLPWQVDWYNQLASHGLKFKPCSL